MTYRVTTRGDSSAPILCDFRCGACGVFEATVPRNDSDFAPCPTCTANSPWSPTPVRGKVRSVEAARGGWDRPESKGYLDTRNLGEGQDYEDFRADRARIRDQLREERLKEEIREVYG